MTLIVTLPVGYPDISPTVDLKNSRGLDDSILDVIKEELDLKIKNLIGDVVVFELIEVGYIYIKCLNFFFLKHKMADIFFGNFLQKIYFAIRI